MALSVKGCAALRGLEIGNACPAFIQKTCGVYSVFSPSGFMVVFPHFYPHVTSLSLTLRMNWIAEGCRFAVPYIRVSAVSIQIQGCDW